MVEKKKIYFLINSLEGGGAERVIINLCSELKNDYNITIFTLKNTNFYEQPQGVTHIPLSQIQNNLIMFLLTPYFAYKLKKILKRETYQSGVSFLEIANFVHILANHNGIISFRTNLGFFQGIFGNIYKILIKLLYPKAKLIIVNSEENRYDLSIQTGIPLDKITTIYNPINFPLIEQSKNEKVEQELLDKTKGKKVFITVGRLIQAKNHKIIIQSLKKIHENIDQNWVYLIVGDGPTRSELEEQRKKLGLENNIIFLGAQQNVFKYLNIADLFLYASRVEGFPNVLLEAIACNLPIITSDFVSGARECILGKFIEGKLEYPCWGENGVIISIENYDKYLVENWEKIINMNLEKSNLDKYRMNNIIENWKLIFNEKEC